MKSMIFNKKQRLITNVIMLFILALLCLLSPYRFASILSCLVMLLYVIYISLCLPNVVIKYLFFVFGIVTNIVGVCVCEFSSLYLSEINSISHYVGSLPILVFSRTIFLVLILEYELKNKNSINNVKVEINEQYLRNFTIVVTVLYLIEFIHVFGHNAILMQVDRYDYSYLGGLWSKLASYSQYLIVVPISYFTYTRKKILPAIAIVIYLLFFLWVGNKFGVFFYAICLVVLIYFSKHEYNKAKLRKYLIRAFICISIIVVLAVIIQLNYDGNNTFTYYILSRLAQQGQLWWKTYENLDGKAFPTSFVNEISATFNPPTDMQGNIGAKNGIYNIMYYCAPANRVNSILSHGARYTEAGYASSYYYFGVFGCLIFSTVMAFLVTRITNLIVKFSKQNSVLGLFIATRLYLFTSGALTMFVFSDFVSRGSLIFYVVLLFYLLGYRLRIAGGKIRLKKGSRKISI